MVVCATDPVLGPGQPVHFGDFAPDPVQLRLDFQHPVPAGPQRACHLLHLQPQHVYIAVKRIGKGNDLYTGQLPGFHQRMRIAAIALGHRHHRIDAVCVDHR